MPVTSATPDLDSQTITIHADYAEPVERVWQVYADPRQLEQIWGPPSYPAHFVDHDLSAGGRMNYYMTGPEGDRFYGYWIVREAEAPRSFTYEDGFADENFAPNPALPGSVTQLILTSSDAGTRLTAVATYPSAEALQTVLDMGVIEGTTEAMNQIDGLLAAG